MGDGKGMEGWKGRENLDDPSLCPQPNCALPAWRNTGHCPGSSPAPPAPPAPRRGQSQGMHLPSKHLCCCSAARLFVVISGHPSLSLCGCYFSKNPTSRDGTRGWLQLEDPQSCPSPPRTSHKPELSLSPAVTAGGDTGVAAQQPLGRAGGTSGAAPQPGW